MTAPSLTFVKLLNWFDTCRWAAEQSDLLEDDFFELIPYDVSNDSVFRHIITTKNYQWNDNSNAKLEFDSLLAKEYSLGEGEEIFFWVSW